MSLNLSVIRAVFWRNFASYFANPVGYLFIFAFTLAGAYFAFNDQFFAANMADLEQLNIVYSLLALLLVPAITMSSWSEERRSGTEELLLTLPGSDLSIVLGKYLACLGIYTVALAFSTVFIFLLRYLGEPDPGLIFSTYFGYWLIGAALLAAGMVASLLTSHTTVAFILGVLICGVLVGVARIGDVVTYTSNLFASLGWIKGSDAGAGGGGFIKDFLPRLSVEGSFQYAFGRGVMTLSAFWYFLAVTGIMLYLNVFLLGRRHWSGGEKAGVQWTHGLVRTMALVVAGIALYVFARRADAVAFVDLTQQRLHALSPETVAVLRSIPEGREVRLEAFLSPIKDLPNEYIEVHRNLREKLIQYEAQGRGKVTLTIHETELYSKDAERAEKSFNIKPVKVPVQEEGRFRTAEFILGVAVGSGRTEMSSPFFYKGLPIEYELTRLIRLASAKDLPQIAVLATAADVVNSGFQEENNWQIVTDLKKQYKVTRVQPGQIFQYDEAPSAEPTAPKQRTIKRDANGEPLIADSLKNVRCLIAPVPSSLKGDEMNDFMEYVKSGRSTLILEDAYCYFNPQLTSTTPSMRNPMMGPTGGQRDIAGLERLTSMLGLEFEPTQAIWQRTNPLLQRHPEIPLEYVPSGPEVVSEPLYDKKHPITAPMRSYVLFLFPGGMKRKGGDGPEVTPLLWTTRDAGTISAEAVQEARMTRRDWASKRQRRPDEYILAAAVTGKPADDGSAAKPRGAKEEKAKAPAKDLNVVFISDIDFITDAFYELQQRGEREYEFENVSFLINCVDYLCGDESLIPLRQKRPQRRTLKRIMDVNKAFQKEAEEELKDAEDRAKKALEDAQKRFNDVAKEIENKTTIRISDLARVEQKREEEQRKLDRLTTEIEQEKNERTRDIQRRTQERLRQQQLAIRFLAVCLPALPVLLLALAVFMIRSRGETEGVAQARLR